MVLEEGSGGVTKTHDNYPQQIPGRLLNIEYLFMLFVFTCVQIFLSSTITNLMLFFYFESDQLFHSFDVFYFVPEGPHSTQRPEELQHPSEERPVLLPV